MWVVLARSFRSAMWAAGFLFWCCRRGGKHLHTRRLAVTGAQVNSESDTEPQDEGAFCQAGQVAYVEEGAVYDLCARECNDRAQKSVALLDRDLERSSVEQEPEGLGRPGVRLCHHHAGVIEAANGQRKCSKQNCWV